MNEPTEKPVDIEERIQIADRLVAVLFSLRPDNDVVGQSWCLDVAVTIVARAIVGANAHPENDPEDIIVTACDQIRQKVDAARAAYYRKKLSAVKH